MKTREEKADPSAELRKEERRRLAHAKHTVRVCWRAMGIRLRGVSGDRSTQSAKANMKLRNLIHIVIGIVCVGLLPGAQAVVQAPAPVGSTKNILIRESSRNADYKREGVKEPKRFMRFVPTRRNR